MLDLFLRAIALVWPFVKEILGGDSDDPVNRAGRRLVTIMLLSIVVNIGAIFYVADIAMTAHNMSVKSEDMLKKVEDELEKTKAEKEDLADKLEDCNNEPDKPIQVCPVKRVIVNKKDIRPTSPDNSRTRDILEEMYKEDH